MSRFYIDLSIEVKADSDDDAVQIAHELGELIEDHVSVIGSALVNTEEAIQ